MKIKAASSVMLETRTAKATPITAVAKKGVIQDTKETGQGWWRWSMVSGNQINMHAEPGMAIVEPGTSKVKLVRPGAEKRRKTISRRQSGGWRSDWDNWETGKPRLDWSPQKKLVKEQIISTDSDAPTTALGWSRTKSLLIADQNHKQIGWKCVWRPYSLVWNSFHTLLGLNKGNRRSGKSKKYMAPTKCKISSFIQWVNKKNLEVQNADHQLLSNSGIPRNPSLMTHQNSGSAAAPAHNWKDRHSANALVYISIHEFVTPLHQTSRQDVNWVKCPSSWM